MGLVRYDLKDEIKARVGILDLLEEMGVRMHAPQGSARISVWCPFCPDEDSNRPAAAAYPDTESYYCFQCDVGGDVIAIAQEYLHGSFGDALKWLDKTFPA